MLWLLLSGERARLRVDVVEVLRIWGGAPEENEVIGEVSANASSLAFIENSRSMAAVEARVAALMLLRVVVGARVEVVANGGTDAEGLCAKKSVNFLFLSLRERFAGILGVACFWSTIAMRRALLYT